MKQHGRGRVALALAATALFAGACAQDGPTQPGLDLGPAFAALGDPIQIEVCKVAVMDDDLTVDPDILGDTYDFTYSINNGPEQSFSLTADVFISNDCNEIGNLYVINAVVGDEITITEKQTNPNSTLWRIANTAGGVVPCLAVVNNGTLVNDGTTAGYIDFVTTPENCGTGAKVWFKNMGDEPPSGGEGCTPGYWKNHADSWPATGFSTGQSVGSVFTGAAPYAGTSLIDALSFGGGPGVDGAKRILLRAAVAGLLNSAHPDVDYTMSTADLIAAVNAALASGDRETMLALAASIDADNNLGCPIN